MNILKRIIRRINFGIRYRYRRIRSKKLITGYFRNNKVVKINLGCGRNLLTGWINCDFYPQPGACYIDCRKRLPFNDECADYIYSEHMIEHLNLEECINLLKESYRILKPSGRIRLATPDLESFINMYKGSPDCGVYLSSYYRKCKNPVQSISMVDCINNIFLEHGHKFIYDYQYLKRLLEYCRFRDVERYEVLKSHDPMLVNLEGHGNVIGLEINKIESLVVEAVK